MTPRRPRVPATRDITDASDALADRCSYEGSREHKDRRSWLGLPQPRRRLADIATICPMVTEEDRRTATEWVKEAIKNHQFDPRDIRNGFPRYIWYRASDGSYWYGFLMNEGGGKYKGWPISAEEWHEIFD